MSFDKHSIGDVNGNGNTVVNGTQVINEAPRAKEGPMCNLLNNIAEMVVNRIIHPELPDNQSYDITDKIIFNNISLYLEYEEYFDDGLYIIEERLRTIEDSSIGNIKPQIFRYVQGFFIRASKSSSSLSADQIVNATELAIINDLKEYYHQHLSPEDISHVPFVVYYVFASCKIFNKPTTEFMMCRNVDT